MSFRNPKLDFASLAMGWAAPDPALENWEPDPDTVPLPGTRKDSRFARQNGGKSNVNKASYSPMPTQNTRPATNVDTNSSVLSSVDLGKGWPAPAERAHGPPRASNPPPASSSQASTNGSVHRSVSSTPSKESPRDSPSPDSLVSWSPSQVEMPKPKTIMDEISTTDAQAFARFRAAKNVILWEEQNQSSRQKTILELMKMEKDEFRAMHDKAKFEYEQLKELQDKRDFMEWRAKHESNAALKTTLKNGHTAYNNTNAYESDEEDGHGAIVFTGRTGRTGWN